MEGVGEWPLAFPLEGVAGEGVGEWPLAFPLGGVVVATDVAVVVTDAFTVGPVEEVVVATVAVALVLLLVAIGVAVVVTDAFTVALLEALTLMLANTVSQKRLRRSIVDGVARVARVVSFRNKIAKKVNSN
jgi:hypothetical protein